MAKMPPKKGDSNVGDWLNTYADMVTLLLTFFVLLFAFSSVSDEKWNTLVEAFTGAPPLRSIAAVDLLSMPNFTEDLPSSYVNLSFVGGGAKEENGEEDEQATGSPWEELTPEQLQRLQLELTEEQVRIMSSEEYQRTEQQFSRLYERLVVYIETNGLEDMLFAERDLDSIYVRVAAGVLFDSAKARLRSDARHVLDTLEEIFYTEMDALSLVSIEGHTDNMPISTYFADNWELSTARALSVMHYLLDKGRLDPEMFSCTGYGEYQPIADNDTEEGKQKNRRVEFVLRKKTITAEDIAQ